MNKFNKLSEKLPNINKEVFILQNDRKRIKISKLQVYHEHSNINTKIESIKEGDIYWQSHDYWMIPKDYPYWISEKDLIKLIFSDEEFEKIENRAEILDL